MTLRLESPHMGEYLADRPGFCDLCAKATRIGQRVFYDGPLRMCIPCSGLDDPPCLCEVVHVCPRHGRKDPHG